MNERYATISFKCLRCLYEWSRSYRVGQGTPAQLRDRLVMASHKDVDGHCPACDGVIINYKDR